MIVALLNQKRCVGKALTLHLVGELACKGNRAAPPAALVLLKCNRRRSMDWVWPSCWLVSAKRASAGPSGAHFVLDGDGTAARDRRTRERDRGDRVMSEWSGKHWLASRPSGPDRRIKAAVTAMGTVDQSAFVVRPTTDMTTQVRDRIAAFQHDVIVADTLRAKLARISRNIRRTLMTGIAAPRMRGAFPVTHHATDNLIHVELTWVEKRIENWIRFGTHSQEQIVDRRRRILSYRPGTVFAFVRWAANDFGTIISRIDIVRAVARGEAYQTLPFVRPGGDILLKVESWPKVERVLQAIDAIQRLNIEPELVSPDHWRHIHNRITAGHAPRAYTLDQHRAFLLRKRTEP